ncbi:UPF0271 protein [Arboricoccus pini]|uniref:UPF0271 protein n=1 Tax=Arboricoccus pini TaxID=1963835 RepID=A0A212RDX7_9PROT|nr:LamB/YcsF family protein [Arboricoccus pini]SNB70490.1 UPF0271 protein [Arboricoccus pini]
MEIDLNSDLGENFAAWHMGDDRTMLEIVTSANIACGFHAGDPSVIARTPAAAIAGVAAGAHPSVSDLTGFSRRPIQGEDPANIRQCLYQIGTLYDQAADDPQLGLARAEAVAAGDQDLSLAVLPDSAMAQTASAVGIPMACGVFADRAYEDDDRLVAGRPPGALIEDAELAATRVVRMVESRRVHGDNPAAVRMAAGIKTALAAEGIRLNPMGRRPSRG